MLECNASDVSDECVPCIEQPQKQIRICKMWARGETCRHRRCPFRHHTSSAAEDRRVAKATAQRQTDVSANVHPDDPHSISEISTHGGRFIEFARWLLATFGATALRARAGVVDVAGGRGGLSFELHCRLGIPCTLLEPRSVGLKSNQLRHLRKHPERGCYRHFRARLDASFEETSEGRALLRDCSMLVGLHSDEATEALVAAAGRFGKPFAVVPCCVFPTVFSTRRRACGKLVRTYDDFCAWLSEQAEGSQIAFLPFAGRNRVVFRTSATSAEFIHRHAVLVDVSLQPVERELEERLGWRRDGGIHLSSTRRLRLGVRLKISIR